MLLNIPELAVGPARQLYKLIEHEFSPLRLATRVQNELEKLTALERDDYSQYIETMKGVVATRVIRQLTVIYDSLSLERFQKIIPFYTRAELEHFLVQTSKHRSVKANISHLDNCVRFNALDLTLAGGIEAGLDIDAASNGIEYVREHLSLLHNQLRESVYRLDGAKFRQHGEDIIKHKIKAYMQNREHDYDRMLQRRKQIESYKETNETQRKEKIQAQHEELIKREEKRRAEEMRRMEEQNRENEQKRIQAEREDIQRRQKAEQLKRFQSNPIYQQIIKERGEEEIMNMDPELVLKEQRERMDVERRENQNKLRQQEKKFDYMIRAFHIEELECYKQASDEYMATAPERYDKCEDRRIEKETEEHEHSLITFDRMNEVRSEAEDFMRKRFAEHADDFERMKSEWRRKLEAEKSRRLNDRKTKRKENRRNEADQLRRDDEERAKADAEQDERDRAEQQRQDNRQMHIRLKERERERERERGMAERDDVRSTVRNMTGEGGGTGVVAPTRGWREDQRPPVVRNMTSEGGATGEGGGTGVVAPTRGWREDQRPPVVRNMISEGVATGGGGGISLGGGIGAGTVASGGNAVTVPTRAWREGNVVPAPQPRQAYPPPQRQTFQPPPPATVAPAAAAGTETTSASRTSGKYVPPQLRRSRQEQ